MTNRKINYFFFKCRPRPTVVYIIVICRQPCALHTSWYTVGYTTPQGGEFTVLCQGYTCTIVFMWVNIPLRGGYINP